MNSLLQAKNLGKVYQKGQVKIQVLQGLSFEIQASQSIAIVGESGAGKSTFLQLLGALAQPTSGEIWFKDQRLSNRTEIELAKFRNEFIGFIFQFHYLLPEFNALENTAFPLRIRGESFRAIEEKAQSLLIKLGLGERWNHRPYELSGGEQQRVAIARAMVGNPEIILADEPTGNLDMDTASLVFDELLKMTQTSGTSLIVATHNIELAKRTDKVLYIKEGSLHQAS